MLDLGLLDLLQDSVFLVWHEVFLPFWLLIKQFFVEQPVFILIVAAGDFLLRNVAAGQRVS